VQTAFEVLRGLYETHRIRSFVSAGGDAYSSKSHDFFDGMPTPSWEYYSSAAEEAVPIYRVELARSGRSLCKKKCMGAKSPIGKGEIRVGSIDLEAGAYGRWYVYCHHRLSCVW